MYVECTFRILKVFPITSRISVQTIKSATCWLKTEMHTVHKMNFTNEILLNSFENMCKSLYKPSHSLCRVQTWPRPAEEVWITDQSSSDGYPLLLSSRQLSAFISNSSVVFLKGYYICIYSGVHRPPEGQG